MHSASSVPRGCEIRSLTASDGVKLSYRRWFWRQPKAVCLVIAGVESHGGWYEASSSKLFEAGFAVYFLDRRGSGLSGGDRGDIRHLGDLYDDIRKLIEYIHVEHRGCPVFLASISWGGRLGLSFSLKYPELVKGLVLITPGLASKVDYSLGQKIAITICSLFSPTTLFKVPIPGADYFTRDPRYIEFIENDKLRLRKITARFCLQTFVLDRFIKQHYQKLQLPVGLFLAGRDRIIDNDSAEHIFEGFSSKTKRMYYYGDANHTLEFDVERGRFVQDICEWMEDLT